MVTKDATNTDVADEQDDFRSLSLTYQIPPVQYAARQLAKLMDATLVRFVVPSFQLTCAMGRGTARMADARPIRTAAGRHEQTRSRRRGNSCLKM